jgi:hypothetical protein
MPQYEQLGRMPVPGGDFTFKNTSSTLTIAECRGALLDTASPPSAGVAPGCKPVPTGGAIIPFAGIAISAVKPGQGTFQRKGVGLMVANGTINYGDYVKLDATAGNEGKALAGSIADGSVIGMAMNTCAAGEYVQVDLDKTFSEAVP